MASFMGNLNTTSRIAGIYRASRLEQAGLTGAQYAYILRICREPGITQEALSRALCIHKSNVARQVEKLEQNGFLTRCQDEADRRVWRVYPTARAEEIRPLVRETVRTWNAYLTADFTEEELDTLLSLMERVRTRAVAYFESGSLLDFEGAGGEKHEETV
jgi:DNA-binding MarR family transcriptional regulator